MKKVAPLVTCSTSRNDNYTIEAIRIEEAQYLEDLSKLIWKGALVCPKCKKYVKYSKLF